MNSKPRFASFVSSTGFEFNMEAVEGICSSFVGIIRIASLAPSFAVGTSEVRTKIKV